ncbi:hypothetical protein ACFO3J_30710 [Streptomyces polygonati]|uniref:Uncharacterized protein n=1 Tax=Streptomyces polygonati TaxID=1617087 RepID=A0ABV8HUX9_9ACTN
MPAEHLHGYAGIAFSSPLTLPDGIDGIRFLPNPVKASQTAHSLPQSSQDFAVIRSLCELAPIRGPAGSE